MAVSISFQVTRRSSCRYASSAAKRSAASASQRSRRNSRGTGVSLQWARRISCPSDRAPTPPAAKLCRALDGQGPIDTRRRLPYRVHAREHITSDCAVGEHHGMIVLREAHEVSAVLSVGKALSIVESMLQVPGPLSAREIGERCSINRTTAHRLLNTLIHHGWIERHVKGGYHLSAKFLALAHISTQTRSFLDEIRPALAPLSELSRETVHVGLLDGFDIVHVDKIESLEHVGVSSRIGARGITHRTSLGKALLAASTDDFVAAYIEQGRYREPPFTLDAAEPVWESVRRTRESGYSLDDEEDSIGVRCLGAAVCGIGGKPLFAISLTGPSPRFTLAVCDRLAPTLVSVARQLSQRFGGERETGYRAKAGGAQDAV